MFVEAIMEEMLPLLRRILEGQIQVERPGSTLAFVRQGISLYVRNPMTRGRSIYQPSSTDVPLGLPSLGSKSLFSEANIWVASPHCLRLFRQQAPLALSLARLRAGKSIAAKMAMMAITTSNSMSVKAMTL